MFVGVYFFNYSFLWEELLLLTLKFSVLVFYLRMKNSHRKLRFLRPHLSLACSLAFSVVLNTFWVVKIWDYFHCLRFWLWYIIKLYINDIYNMYINYDSSFLPLIHFMTHGTFSDLPQSVSQHVVHWKYCYSQIPTKMKNIGGVMVTLVCRWHTSFALLQRTGWESPHLGSPWLSSYL